MAETMAETGILPRVAKHAPDPLKVLYKGATAQIAAIDLDATATRLAAADWKGAVTLWNLGDPKPRWQVSVDGWRCQAVAFGVGRVYVTTASGRVLALDAETGDAVVGVDSVPTCNGHDRLLLRGDLLLCFGDLQRVSGAVTALDAATLAVRWQRTANELGRGADDERLYTVNRAGNAAGYVLRALSLADGVVRDERATELLPVGLDAPRAVFAVGTPEYTEFRPYDALEVPSVRAPIGAWNAEPSRFSPDGKLFAVAEGSSVAFCGVCTGAVERSAVKHTRLAAPLRWSPDGTYVLTGGWDKTVRAHPVPATLRDPPSAA